MSIRLSALLAGLALLSGCSSTVLVHDPFQDEAAVAARREAETTVLAHVDRERACVHVTEVLMDLECDVVAVDAALGVVSARGGVRAVPPRNFLAAPGRRQYCGNARVTVSVNEIRTGTRVRATFDPPSEHADRAFRRLLQRSVTLETAAGHASRLEGAEP